MKNNKSIGSKIVKILFITLASIITLVVIITVIGMNSQGNESESEEPKQETTSKEKNKDTELDTKIDELISNERFSAIETNKIVYDNHQQTKEEMRKENDRIFEETDKVEKEIKKDDEYKKLKELEKDDNLTSREILDFTEPYLDRISNLQQYSE
ncbi:hypothetical protein [Staphylococcus xylosus]